MEIRVFSDKEGKEPFNEFLDSVKSMQDRGRIYSRLDRVEKGNLGDHSPVGDGVSELRFFFGSGYRVYFGMDGIKMIILLCGGDKSTQKKDIKLAKEFWKIYKEGR